jgi:hypothetical protein
LTAAPVIGFCSPRRRPISLGNGTPLRVPGKARGEHDLTRRAGHRRSRPWAGLCLGASLLSGCADLEAYLNPPPEPPPAPVAKPAAPPSAALVQPEPPRPPPRPTRKPVPPPPGVTPVSRSPAEPIEPQPEAVRPPPPGPEILRGMRPEEVSRVLGDPWQRAEAAPATVWRYVTRECQLDLYFYLDLQSRVTRVLDIVLRPADYGGERCLEQLVAERNARERDGVASGPSGPR